MGSFPSENELRSSLQLLYNEGWRGLVTYSLDGTLREAPRIAKEVGFDAVIAGLFWFDEAQLARERSAALAELAYIDGFVVGNEGLATGRYSRERLDDEVLRLQAETDRPVSTSEPAQVYIDDPTLLAVGDWAFPNIHPWFANIRTIPEAVEFVESQYRQLQELSSDRTVITKEAWWPTSGGVGASVENQVEFFRQLADTPVRFVWGEAFDQFWKEEEGEQGTHWGLHNDVGDPKQIIFDLSMSYLSAYQE